MSDGQQILCVHIVGADGYEIAPRHVLTAVDEERQAVYKRACAEVDVHTGSELCADLVLGDALVVGYGASDQICRELLTGAVGCMPLQEHSALDALLDYGVHTLGVVDDADIVHYLGNTDDIIHVEQSADLGRAELRAGVFKAGDGRHAGWGENVLAELRFFCVVKHELYAFNAHNVAYLVGVCADRGGAPWEDGAGEIFGDHHGAFHMYMRVDEAGDEISAAAVVVFLCGEDGLLPFFAH